MSETGNGDANGEAKVTVPIEALQDELVLTFNRLDGTLKIGGRTINLDVALDICQRGVRFFETQLRIASVAAVRQQQEEHEHVQQILGRHGRPGRG